MKKICITLMMIEVGGMINDYNQTYMKAKMYCDCVFIKNNRKFSLPSEMNDEKIIKRGYTYIYGKKSIKGCGADNVVTKLIFI